MQARLFSGTLLIYLILFGSSVQAQVDWSDYDALWQALVEGHSALAEAGESDDTPALIADAISRDTRFLMWMDEAIATDDFSHLEIDRQLSLLNARNRVQFLRAGLFLQNGDCEEAQADIEAIQWRPNVDEELRQALNEQLRAITDCVSRQRFVNLDIDCRPSNAEVWIDGSLIGPADQVHEVALGEHSVVLRAPGFEDDTFTFSAQVEGETIEHGPIQLELVEEPVETVAEVAEPAVETEQNIGLRETAPPPDHGPGATPFVLIGAGAALAIGGLIYDFTVVSETVDNLEAVQAECDAGCTVIRHDYGEQLQDDLGTERIIDGLLYGGAVAAVTVGVILLVTGGDSSSDPSVVVVPTLGLNRLGGSISVDF